MAERAQRDHGVPAPLRPGAAALAVTWLVVVVVAYLVVRELGVVLLP